MQDTGSENLFARIKMLSEAAGLPGVECGTSYGRPALKVGGKGFASVKDAGTVVIAISIQDKELLIEMAPQIYYQTDHYVGWPSLPLRAGAISDEELKQRLIDAWRFRAPPKQRAAFDGQR